jgi:mRNA-degrading endonuclease RelE of RelBE toxin-antitoxin system
MNNSVYLSKHFAHSLEQLPRDQQTEVVHTIDQLADDPLQNSYAVPFSNADEMRLAPAGDLRLIFRYQPADSRILIMDLHKKEELSA